MGRTVHGVWDKPPFWWGQLAHSHVYGGGCKVTLSKENQRKKLEMIYKYAIIVTYLILNMICLKSTFHLVTDWTHSLSFSIGVARQKDLEKFKLSLKLNFLCSGAAVILSCLVFLICFHFGKVGTLALRPPSAT